jgi:hypothetical protein
MLLTLNIIIGKLIILLKHLKLIKLNVNLNLKLNYLRYVFVRRRQ